jgi:polyribonucleotide nucleotidyltransferase
MQTNSDYTSYLAAMQNYETTQGRKEYQAPFANGFEAIYNKAKEQEIEAEETDNAVTQFVKDLRTKGAAKFLSNLNKEKIEKLVEEYRAKLIENMGDSPEAMQEIEKMVKDFKKKLMEEMRERMEDEAKNKGKTTPISFNSVVQKLIDLAQKQTVKPLEKLLQS